MTAEALTGIRASSCVGCKRKGFYEGVSQEREELPRRVERLFRIRSMQNDAVLAEKAQEAAVLGRRIILEQDVPWGPPSPTSEHGQFTGHADWADWTDYEVIEATGSADLTPDRRKVLQAAFYAKRLSEITGKRWKATVLVFDPGTGEERYVPVNWQALAFELDDIFATVLGAVEEGVEPERVVCTAPNSGPAQFCSFAGYCFRDFTYPTPGEIADVELAAAIVEYDALNGSLKQPLAEKDVKVLRERIAPALAAGGRYLARVGGEIVEVKRSDVAESETISLKEIRDAGFDLPTELLPFVKTRAGHTRLATKRIEGAQ